MTPRGRPPRLGPRYGRAFADWLEGKLADLRALRAEPGLSNSEAARLLDVDHALISRWLGRKQLPSRGLVRRLAVAFTNVGLVASVAEIEAAVSDSAEPESGAIMHPRNGALGGSQTAPGSGRMDAEEAPAPPAAITRPAVLFYGPHGQIDGQDELTDEEAAAVLASIAAFRARRANRRGSDAGGRGDGVGGPG